MPYQDPDPQDPNMLVGVSVKAGRDSILEMAYTFAEEFAALGFSEERLLHVFRHPHYAGPHRAYKILGEEEVQRVIAESVAVWGRFRGVVTDAPAGLVQIGSGKFGHSHDGNGNEEDEPCRA